MNWGSFQHAVFDAVKGKSNHGNFLFPTRSPKNGDDQKSHRPYGPTGFPPDGSGKTGWVFPGCPQAMDSASCPGSKLKPCVGAGRLGISSPVFR